jgi:UDP-N-acetylglucosamine acyltransferase
MIHPTAIVEPGAQLGVDVQIGPHAFVAATARLGDACVLGPNAVVLDHATLGARCTLHAGAVVGGLPQDLSFGGEPSFVEIGDDCTFREGATVNRGTKPGSVTRLGRHVFMMANSHVAHNCVVGDHVVFANNAMVGGYAVLGDRCFLGGGVGIHQFCRVGRLAMVGALCFVSKDLPPFCTSVSCANSHVGGLNLVGLRRNGFEASARAQVKRAFVLLYRSGLNRTQAADALRAESDNPFAAEFADFIQTAKRGICRPSFGAAAAEGDDA